MSRPILDDRDPAPETPHTPVSSAWARKAALDATRAAVEAAKEARKRPAGEVAK